MSSQQLSKEEKTAYLKKWFNDDNLEQWIQQNNNAKTDDEKNKSADICYIDINDKDKKINFLAETNCWSWQLGTRLTWSKKNVEEFYFNFFCATKGNFCTVQHNIKTNQANHFYGSFI